MAYIGNTTTSIPFIADSFSGNASTTSFSPLTRAPAGTASIAVFIAGVYQAPSTYSLVGTTITFGSAPASGVGNIIVLHLGNGSTTQVPSDGSVTLLKISGDTYGYINTAFTAANTPSYTANSGAAYANAAFTKANTAANNTIIASSYANSAFSVANNAFTSTNGTIAWATANSADSYANSAFLKANTTVTAANGGTGLTTLTANNVVLGNGTSAVQFVSPGTNGNLLTSDGTTWTSAAPPASGVTSAVAGNGITVSGATGAVTISLDYYTGTNTNITSYPIGSYIMQTGAINTSTTSNAVNETRTLYIITSSVFSSQGAFVGNSGSGQTVSALAGTWRCRGATNTNSPESGTDGKNVPALWQRTA